MLTPEEVERKVAEIRRRLGLDMRLVPKVKRVVRTSRGTLFIVVADRPDKATLLGPGSYVLSELLKELGGVSVGVRSEVELLVKRKRLEFAAERVRELDAEGRLEEVVPPRFYLTRSDGTWLYTATDVAYSLYKIEGVGVEVCYNVIGAEQRLEQLQVRASVALAGEDPDRIQHFSYEMVNLVGVTMSGRLGIYVTLDELMDEGLVRKASSGRFMVSD